MTRSKRCAIALFVAVLAMSVPGLARAQQGVQAGSGPVRIIHTSTAGSAGDAVARALAESLAEILGQTAIVENVVGGAGVVGTTRLMQSRRDGNTIISLVSGALIGPLLDRNLPYEIGRDLIPVSQITAASAVFVVTPSAGAATLQEFLARARDSRDPLPFGNYGYGSSSHLHGMLLARRSGISVEPIPFNGTPPLVSEMLGGRLCCAFIDAGSAQPFIRAGQLRPLGVTGPRRIADLPEVPALAELGMAGFEPQIWQGMFLPSGTPPELVEAMGRAMAEATRRPGPTRVIRGFGYEPVGSRPAEFAAMIAQDTPVWRRIIEETNVRIR